MPERTEHYSESWMGSWNLVLRFPFVAVGWLLQVVVSNRTWPRAVTFSDSYRRIAQQSFSWVLGLAIILSIGFFRMITADLPITLAWLGNVLYYGNAVIHGLIAGLFAWMAIRRLAFSSFEAKEGASLAALYAPAMWVLRAFTLVLLAYALYHLVRSLYFTFQMHRYQPDGFQAMILPLGQRVAEVMAFVLIPYLLIQRFCEFGILRAVDYCRGKPCGPGQLFRILLRIVFSSATLLYVGTQLALAGAVVLLARVAVEGGSPPLFLMENFNYISYGLLLLVLVYTHFFGRAISVRLQREIAASESASS